SSPSPNLKPAPRPRPPNLPARDRSPTCAGSVVTTRATKFSPPSPSKIDLPKRFAIQFDINRLVHANQPHAPPLRRQRNRIVRAPRGFPLTRRDPGLLPLEPSMPRVTSHIDPPGIRRTRHNIAAAKIGADRSAVLPDRGRPVAPPPPHKSTQQQRP